MFISHPIKKSVVKKNCHKIMLRESYFSNLRLVSLTFSYNEKQHNMTSYDFVCVKSKYFSIGSPKSIGIATFSVYTIHKAKITVQMYTIFAHTSYEQN